MIVQGLHFLVSTDKIKNSYLSLNFTTEMRLLVFLAALGTSLALRGSKKMINPPESVSKAQFDEMWYDQKLDHFDITGSPLWRQRYWYNFAHYEEGGPALIMIGGEGEASPGWLNYGIWTKYAEENNAALFLLEHRFYGQSHPTEDMATENMRYLSSRQALEDLATFMTSMSMTHNITGPWVSFGGSYPGSLSAWLKLKYPHLLAGAVSSSGPLNAKLDFHEYLGVVKSALETTGAGCNEAITEALKTIEMLLADEFSWDLLSEMFKTCKPLTGNSKDVKSFVELLIDNLAGIVQYNGLLEMDIFEVCDIMRDESYGEPIERFAKVNSLSLANNGAECLDHEYSSFLALLTDTSFAGEGVGWRQWIWQTCTEFGWYQTTNQPEEVYGRLLDLEFFESWCADAFSELDWTHEKLEQEMIDTNTEYGGFYPVVNNVVFVHGSIDPWHAMGVLEDLSESATSIFIEGTSHCNDMYSNSPGDSEGLVEAREKIGVLVSKWIEEASMP